MIGIYQIDDPKAQRTVYKPYIMVYEGNVRTKVWGEGVYKTRKQAEDAGKKLLKNK